MLDREKQYSHQLEEKNDAIELEQRLKRRAELQALQAQINPHFLYNTLDSIRWKAEAAGAEDISQMVRDLANFFRIGLSPGAGDHSAGARDLPCAQLSRHPEDAVWRSIGLSDPDPGGTEKALHGQIADTASGGEFYLSRDQGIGPERHHSYYSRRRTRGGLSLCP